MFNPFRQLELVKSEVFMSIHHLANIAFGGPDRRTVYITDSLSGDILTAKLPVAGKVLYCHQ